MSKQHTGEYTPEEVEELRSRYSNERVDSMVAEAKAVAAEESAELLGGESDPYDVTVPELQEILKERGLPTDGKKAELQQRLRDDDAK